MTSETYSKALQCFFFGEGVTYTIYDEHFKNQLIENLRINTPVTATATSFFPPGKISLGGFCLGISPLEGEEHGRFLRVALVSLT